MSFKKEPPTDKERLVPTKERPLCTGCAVGLHDQHEPGLLPLISNDLKDYGKRAECKCPICQNKDVQPPISDSSQPGPPTEPAETREKRGITPSSDFEANLKMLNNAAIHPTTLTPGHALGCVCHRCRIAVKTIMPRVREAFGHYPEIGNNPEPLVKAFLRFAAAFSLAFASTVSRDREQAIEYLKAEALEFQRKLGDREQRIAELERCLFQMQEAAKELVAKLESAEKERDEAQTLRDIYKRRWDEQIELTHAAEQALAREKEQSKASTEAERRDCEKALLALAGAHYPTPVETYGTNSSWAISDLCRAVKELPAQAIATERDRIYQECIDYLNGRAAYWRSQQERRLAHHCDNMALEIYTRQRAPALNPEPEAGGSRVIGGR